MFADDDDDDDEDEHRFQCRRGAHLPRAVRERVGQGEVPHSFDGRDTKSWLSSRGAERVRSSVQVGYPPPRSPARRLAIRSGFLRSPLQLRCRCRPEPGAPRCPAVRLFRTLLVVSPSIRRQALSLGTRLMRPTFREVIDPTADTLLARPGEQKEIRIRSCRSV